MAYKFTKVALLALLGMLLVAVVAGCSAPAQSSSSSTSKTASGPNVVVTAKDASTTVLGVVGKPIIVQLPANPSTGYTWQASTVPTFMAQAGAPTFQTEATGTVVGAGGEQSFTFTVKAAGSGPLSLVYLRPFEKGVPPAKTFNVTVTTY